jgi:hypothetical protein
VVVDDLNVERLTLLPAKGDSPLDVDANRVMTLPLALQGFEPIARWSPEILQMLCVVQIEELSPRYAPQLRRELSHGPRRLVVPEVLGETISEPNDHRGKLSDYDNIATEDSERNEVEIARIGRGRRARLIVQVVRWSAAFASSFHESIGGLLELP